MTSSNGILADVGTIDEAFAALSKGGGNWGMESGRSADKIQTPANLLASTKGENGEDLQWSVPGLAAKICRACMGKRRVFKEEAFGPGIANILFCRQATVACPLQLRNEPRHGVPLRSL